MTIVASTQPPPTRPLPDLPDEPSPLPAPGDPTPAPEPQTPGVSTPKV
jgi:hypothetical protein